MSRIHILISHDITSSNISLHPICNHRHLLKKVKPFASEDSINYKLLVKFHTNSHASGLSG